MQIPLFVKQLAYPKHGETYDLRFNEGGWLSAAVPDEERFGLSRELILQRVYGEIEGGTVVDAGANAGLFSIIASRHANRVAAIEPDPANRKLLRENLDRNGISNVDLIDAALWSREGTIHFDSAAHSTGRRVVSNGGIEVTAVTIEQLVERYGEIDLLKMDVEGAEEAVIPTACLDRVHRLVAELHLSQPGQERPMVEALENAGFKVKLLPAASLYSPRWLGRVLRNWRALKGQTLIKVGLIVYLLMPVTKPRRPPGARDMPLLVATR